MTVRITLAIEDELYKKIEDAGRKAKFATGEGFIVYALEQIFPREVDRLDQDETRLLEQRLHDLGYM